MKEIPPLAGWPSNVRFVHEKKVRSKRKKKMNGNSLNHKPQKEEGLS